MKTFIVVSLLAFAAAGAYALDLNGIFGGCGKPAAFKDLVSADVPAAPAPSAADKPGNCTFPLNIKPDEASYFIQIKNPVVIDIRTQEEYDAGHLEAASMRLDYYAPDFKDQLAKLDKTAKYLIYCRTGHRSGVTLGIMQNMGFTDIHDIDGGITAWTAAGLPVVK